MITTRAVVISAPAEFALRDVVLSEPAAGDVTVETLFTSVSAGTERMLLAGRMPHPMLQFPVVPGYETVGRVAAVGPAANPALLGQLVYVGGARCYTDVNPAWGGQAARLHADGARVVPLGDLPAEQGVLLALGATALHGVNLLDAALAGLAGKRVLTLGQGPVGQFAARIAQQRGAWVAASDRTHARLALAKADLLVDATTEDLAARVGEPVHAIIEATGSMAALAAALPLLANDGVVLLLGYYDTIALPYMPLFLKQARLLTAREWAAGDPARVRDLLASGALDAAALLTHRAPLADLAAAYATALEDPTCLKLVIDWR